MSKFDSPEVNAVYRKTLNCLFGFFEENTFTCILAAVRSKNVFCNRIFAEGEYKRSPSLTPLPVTRLTVHQVLPTHHYGQCTGSSG